MTKKKIEEENVVAEELIPPKKKYRTALQSNQNITAEPNEISNIVSNAFTLFKQPRCKSDEEVAERLNWYFQEYIKNGAMPTVEGMALALGVSHVEVWYWEQGMSCSPERTAMIKRAKGILAECDAQLVAKGKIPVVSYIFRSKNFYGMKDQTEYVLTPNRPDVDRKQLIEAAEMLPEE